MQCEEQRTWMLYKYLTDRGVSFTRKRISELVKLADNAKNIYELKEVQPVKNKT